MTFFPCMDVKGSAVISDCKRYRYVLTRIWDPMEYALTFCMLNPSTADAEQDDPTIRRCISFARREEYGGINIVNMFAFRATKPSALWQQADPFGPENETWLNFAITNAKENGTPIVCAWGANAPTNSRAEILLKQSGVRLKCLGTTQNGSPRHPLMLWQHTPLVDWLS